jgi:hypothetical protein
MAVHRFGLDQTRHSHGGIRIVNHTSKVKARQAAGIMDKESTPCRPRAIKSGRRFSLGDDDDASITSHSIPLPSPHPASTTLLLFLNPYFNKSNILAKLILPMFGASYDGAEIVHVGASVIDD